MADLSRAPATGTHLTFKANRGRGRHGWLRLTPAYSVHLVETLVHEMGERGYVLDPFCGTGTTALVCAQAGIPCHTVDINPFLVWLTEAKCAVYRDDDVAAARVTLDLALGSEDGETRWRPPIHDISRWWDATTLERLAGIYHRMTTAAVSPAALNLLRIVFCRAAIAVSRASFRHQSMSFHGVATDLPHAAREDRLRAAFGQAASNVLDSAVERVSGGQSRAFVGDARDLRAAVGMTIPEGGYTAVITSPPYPNRMSYVRELRPYMYWLGYLSSGREAGELDWAAIGGTWGSATSRLTTWEAPGPLPVGASIQDAVDRVGERSPILGRYVMRYIHDTADHLVSLRAVLAPGARVVYVVGNSRFYDVMLETERLYADLLSDVGFHDVAIQTLRKRTSKKELFEFAVTATV